MIMDEHDVIDTVEPTRAQILQLPGSQPNEPAIELDTDPPAYQIAEIARKKLQVIRENILWDSPTSAEYYVKLLGQAVEQLLGQYHQDNKPKENP